jgi:hypothetical protein
MCHYFFYFPRGDIMIGIIVVVLVVSSVIGTGVYQKIRKDRINTKYLRIARDAGMAVQLQK